MFNKKNIILLIVILLIPVILLGCSENEVAEEQDDEEIMEELKSKYDVRWDWRDIAYDIANSKRREFLIVGNASLSDYYNYGYSNRGYNKNFEKEYFNVSVTPFLVNGQSSERWNLYLHRESFKDLFEEF